MQDPDAIRPKPEVRMHIATAKFSPWASRPLHHQPQLSLMMSPAPIFIGYFPTVPSVSGEGFKTSWPFQTTHRLQHPSPYPQAPLPAPRSSCPIISLGCFADIYECHCSVKEDFIGLRKQGMVMFITGITSPFIHHSHN